VQLSVQTVVWTREAPRKTRLKVYSDRFFPPDRFDTDAVAEELRAPLAEAWEELGRLTLAEAKAQSG